MIQQTQAKITVKYKLFLVLLSLIGAIIILFSTSHFGVGVSPDSVLYISVARNIIKGVGFVDFHGSPLITYPPLYPTILASISFIIGKDPVSTDRILNVILFGIIIYLSGLLFAKYLVRPPFLAFLGTISVLVSVPIIPVVLMAWSEPPFICFVLLYLFFLESYLSKQTFYSLLLLSISVSLACLTRYVGIIIIPTGMASIFIFSKNNLKVKLRHLLFFILITALPISVWVLRNYFLSGTLFGPREISTYSYYQNIAAVFNNMLEWYLPENIALSLPLLVLICAIVAFIIGVEFRVVWGKAKKYLAVYGPLLTYILIYTGFLIISSRTAFWQIIDNRYLSPIFIPVTILLILFAEVIFSSLPTHLSQRITNICLGMIIAISLIYPAVTSISFIENQFPLGLGYASKYWEDSETIQYILKHQTLGSACTIYSNGSDVLYLFAKLNVKSTPEKSSGATVIARISTLNGIWPQEGNACIVQFDAITWRDYLFSPSELMTVSNLERVIKFDDGAIYFVSRK